MNSNKPILVFEHKHLLIGEQGFSRHHWEALGWYNEKHGGCFFSLTPKGVKFNQYVGVIQVGNLTIEILPKVSKTVEKGDEKKWQQVLIDMLRQCNWMQIHTHEKAVLRFKPNSILEAYLDIFVQQCEEVLRKGLIKKYRTTASNCTSLKGKFVFHKQIQANSIHKEKFYTQYQVFDKDNIFNQILLKALKLIPKISQSPFLKDRVYGLVLAFPELADLAVSPQTFKRLVFDRKTEAYKEVIEIAAMLLLNYRPDISTGQNHVLAILFDMNDLWEEYIFRQLLKRKHKDWVITSQNSKQFWRFENNKSSKIIRPDIVIHNKTCGSTIILDTKWKLPEQNTPADSDLKQMFVYNEYWQSKNAILIYPNADYTAMPVYYEGIFAKKKESQSLNSCGVMKVTILDENNYHLDKIIGSRIGEFLIKNIFKSEEVSLKS